MCNSQRSMSFAVVEYDKVVSVRIVELGLSSVESAAFLPQLNDSPELPLVYWIKAARIRKY